MAFLKENSNFPPDNWSYWMDKYNEYGAWYSGDTQEICNYYSYRIKELNNIFWSRLERAERSNAVHLPAYFQKFLNLLMIKIINQVKD